MYNSINVYDWQTVLTLLEVVAWAAIVGTGIVFLTQTKAKWLTKQNKQIIQVIFAAWALASIGLACISTYSYFHTDRKSILQSIEGQKKQYGQ